MLYQLYVSAPYPLKVLMLNVKALVDRYRRKNKRYHNYLREYDNTWLAPASEVYAIQKDNLTSLMLDCYRHVPFYKKRFLKLGLGEDDIKNNPFETLKHLPVLTKRERRVNLSTLINNSGKRPLKLADYTSGTSGVPMKFYLDAESIERSFAIWARFHKIIGLSYKERSVRFSGRVIVNPRNTQGPFWVTSFIDDRLFMSSYHLSEENMHVYIDKLNRFKPTFIDGYPSAIYNLARYINSHGVLLSFQLKAIATTAETLHDYQRKEIETAFRCKVYNQYASSEGSPFITECTSGNLHINEDSGFFEFYNLSNEIAQPGEMARMVITSLRNFKTPLLRYDNGDVVVLAKEGATCDCGCNMKLVDRVIGRQEDVLWTPHKGYIGRIDMALRGIEGLMNTQIVQKTPSVVVVNMVTAPSFTKADESLLAQNLQHRLGKETEVIINTVDDIPLGANGKMRTIVRQFELN